MLEAAATAWHAEGEALPVSLRTRTVGDGLDRKQGLSLPVRTRQRRNRTFQAVVHTALLALKASWATRPLPPHISRLVGTDALTKMVSLATPDHHLLAVQVLEDRLRVLAARCQCIA